MNGLSQLGLSGQTISTLDRPADWVDDPVGWTVDVDSACPDPIGNLGQRDKNDTNAHFPCFEPTTMMGSGQPKSTVTVHPGGSTDPVGWTVTMQN